jgi:SAM-dependent methyltransferase
LSDSTHVRNLIRSGWDEAAPRYGQDGTDQFERFGERLLGLMDVPAGASLLDVGAGTGIVTRLASRRAGRVVGVDLSRRMLIQAAGRAGESSPVTFAQMDAGQLGFAEGAFDALVCAFSLFQFVDMSRALQEMARVVRPGGQVGLSNWGPGWFTPVAAMQRHLFREFGLKPLLANPLVFRPDDLRALLEAAGWVDVRLESEAVDLWFPDPPSVWEYNVSMGPFVMMLRRQLSAEQRANLRERYLDMLREIASPQGVRCTFHPLYALARKP